MQHMNIQKDSLEEMNNLDVRQGFISLRSMDINIKSVDIKAMDGFAICLMIVEVKNISVLEKNKSEIEKITQQALIEEKQRIKNETCFKTIYK